MPANPTLRRGGVLLTIVAGTLAVLLVVALGTVWFVQRDRALPNTSVAGVDVGGASEAEIRSRLEPIAEVREDAAVAFTIDGEEHTLIADEVGYEIDVDATTAAVLERGRSGLPGDVAVRVAALGGRGDDVALVQRLDDRALATWVDEVADEIDHQERRGDVLIDADTATVELEPSRGGVEVDRERLRELARAGLLEPGRDRFELPVTETSQPIADDDVVSVAEQVEEALAEPLVLRSDDSELTLAPTDLAALIDVVETSGGETGTTLALVVSESSVEDVLGDVGPRRFDVSPTDAGYTASRTPPSIFDVAGDATYRPEAAEVGVEPGRDGRRFDPERAARQLTELVRSGTRQAALDLERVEAGLSEERARDLRPTHVIGTFTTYHQAGQDRNTNIALLADTIDGTVVLPGESFSINEVSGERTCEAGYVPAGTIIEGELVDTCGGGTSQFGTTTFNAAFFAGMQLDDWKAHSWYIERYPMGREATLSYPVLDVEFTNTSDGAVLVKTAHTDTSVTVTLYGQPLAEAVTATHGQPTDERGYGTEVRTTSSVPSGQEQVVQPGGEGFRVEVERTIELLDDGEETETITTTYQPQTRIVERGPG